MNDADREFLANQKLEEANRIYYKDISNAFKLYSEAIELNPNYKVAYKNRGNVYY